MLTPITRALQRKLLEMEEISFRTRSRLTLPMRKSPIRFAVQQTSGITSNAWGVQTENTGDAYVYCRDCMKGQKSAYIDPGSNTSLSMKKWPHK